MEDFGPWFWLTALGAVLVTAVLIVIMWQGIITGRTAIKADKQDSYRKLAEKAVENDSRLAASGERTAAALEDLRLRVAALEKMMKEVA